MQRTCSALRKDDCITALTMTAAGDKATLAIDESLLSIPTLLLCAGYVHPATCAVESVHAAAFLSDVVNPADCFLAAHSCNDPLDHSQHNVVELSPTALLELLAEAGTNVVSLQTGELITAPAVIVPAKDDDAGAADTAALPRKVCGCSRFQLRCVDMLIEFRV